MAPRSGNGTRKRNLLRSAADQLTLNAEARLFRDSPRNLHRSFLPSPSLPTPCRDADNAALARRAAQVSPALGPDAGAGPGQRHSVIIPRAGRRLGHVADFPPARWWRSAARRLPLQAGLGFS